MLRRVNSTSSERGHSTRRQCLLCGMQHQLVLPDITDRAQEPLCSKCDSPLFSQSDGSTVTVDIAHQQETVARALEKFELALNRAWQHSCAARLRLIVGGGLIRDAVLAELYFKKSQATVLDFVEENRGAVLVIIRQAD